MKQVNFIKRLTLLIFMVIPFFMSAQTDSIPDNIEYSVKKVKGKYVISQVITTPQNVQTVEFLPMDTASARKFLDNALVNNDSIAVRIEADLKEIQLNIDWHKKQLEAFQAKKKQLQMEGQIAIRQRPKLIKLREKIN